MQGPQLCARPAHSGSALGLPTQATLCERVTQFFGEHLRYLLRHRARNRGA